MTSATTLARAALTFAADNGVTPAFNRQAIAESWKRAHASSFARLAAVSGVRVTEGLREAFEAELGREER